MYAIPQPLRDECLKNFLETRIDYKNIALPSNYAEWSKAAFGNAFYENFPKQYTKKYWTLSPEFLTTDWMGERIFYPNIEDVKEGYIKPLEKQTHYISKIRYPKNGGYFSYFNKLKEGMNVLLTKEITYISFYNRFFCLSDGSTIYYDRLIVTIPLPELILKSDAPDDIKESARKLSCTSLLLVNITANHPTLLKYNWMYVYDEDKYSTRINCTELLSPNNAPIGKTGIQVEVYFSKYKPLEESLEVIAEKVLNELIEMGLIQELDCVLNLHTKWVQYANIIFDHNRKESLNNILEYLTIFGLSRNEQDLHSMTNWDNHIKQSESSFFLSGRFAEWKYYWSDDCLLSGLHLGSILK